MRDNKGFSMIELIVVVAIMAIVVGGSVGMYSTISSSRLKTVSQGVNGAISSLYSKSMSKTESYELKVYYNSDDIVCEIFENGTSIDKTTTKNYGSIKVTGYATDTSTSTTFKNLAAGSYLYFTYNKVDGSFENAELVDSSNNIEIEILDSLEFSYNERSTTLNIVKSTGKHYFD